MAAVADAWVACATLGVVVPPGPLRRGSRKPSLRRWGISRGTPTRGTDHSAPSQAGGWSVTGMDGMITPVGRSTLDVVVGGRAPRGPRRGGARSPCSTPAPARRGSRPSAEGMRPDRGNLGRRRGYRWEGPRPQTAKIALAVASQAVRDSGLFEGRGIDRTRFGVYLGSGEGQADFHRFVATSSAGRSTAAVVVTPEQLTGLGDRAPRQSQIAAARSCSGLARPLDNGRLYTFRNVLLTEQHGR